MTLGAHLGESGGCPFTESWHASLPNLPPPPTAVFASAQALSEQDLFREPLSAGAHTTCEHVLKLESSGSFSCSGVRLVENETSQVTNEMSEIPRENQTKGTTDCSHTSCWPTIPSSSLRVGSLRRLDSLFGDVESFDGPPSTRYEIFYLIVHNRETKNAQSGRSCSSATRAFGMSWNLSKWPTPCHPPFPITDSTQQFGHSLLLNTSLVSNDNSTALACHVNVTTLHGLRGGGATVSRSTTTTTHRPLDL